MKLTVWEMDHFHSKQVTVVNVFQDATKGTLSKRRVRFLM